MHGTTVERNDQLPDMLTFIKDKYRTINNMLITLLSPTAVPSNPMHTSAPKYRHKMMTLMGLAGDPAVSAAQILSLGRNSKLTPRLSSLGAGPTSFIVYTTPE